MKLLPLVILLGMSGIALGQEGGSASVSPPPLPWHDENSIRLWVEQTVTEAPPQGGNVTMIKHWPPHYAKNDKVGEIWIVTAICKVIIDKDTQDHELNFCVFHVDTGKSDIAVSMRIPEEKLQEYMDAADKK